MILYNKDHPEPNERVQELYYEKHGKPINADRPELCSSNKIAYNIYNFSITLFPNTTADNLPGIIAGCDYYNITDPWDIEFFQGKVREIMKIEKDYTETQKRKAAIKAKTVAQARKGKRGK